jgi:hypothetical protein
LPEVITNFVCNYPSKPDLRLLWYGPSTAVALSAVRYGLVSVAEVSNSSAVSSTGHKLVTGLCACCYVFHSPLLFDFVDLMRFWKVFLQQRHIYDIRDS